MIDGFSWLSHSLASGARILRVLRIQRIHGISAIPVNSSQLFRGPDECAIVWWPQLPHTHITPFPTASAPTACHSHSPSPFLPVAPQSLHIYTHILRPYSTRLTCRFMPPITPSTWKTARTADRFSPVCPQNVPIPPNGPEALLEVPRARLAQLRRLLPLLKNQSEDCLYLNIYVPYETQTARRKSQIA